MNPLIQNWKQRRVWVIGASTGIGAETAKRLLSYGAEVALSARQVLSLQETAKGYPQALIEPVDITDLASLQAAHERLLQRWKTIDLVLVVAGTYNEMRVDSFDRAALNHLWNTKVLAVNHGLVVFLQRF